MPEVISEERRQSLDLRAQDQASEAAVKAIMEKWRLTVEHQDEVAQQTQQPHFTQSQPHFTQSQPQFTQSQPHFTQSMHSVQSSK